MGARIATTARKGAERNEAKAHLKAMRIEALPVVCDMSDVASIPAMVDKVIAAYGPIDILVNNAGISWGASALAHPLDALNKVIT
mgnify:CR=1 FL=1